MSVTSIPCACCDPCASQCGPGDFAPWQRYYVECRHCIDPGPRYAPDSGCFCYGGETVWYPIVLFSTVLTCSADGLRCIVHYQQDPNSISPPFSTWNPVGVERLCCPGVPRSYYALYKGMTPPTPEPAGTLIDNDPCLEIVSAEVTQICPPEFRNEWPCEEGLWQIKYTVQA